MNRACFELEGNSYTYLTSRETHTLQGKPHLRLFFLPSLFKSIRPCKFDSICTSLAFCQRKKLNSRWIYNLFHSGPVLAKHRMMGSCCWQHGYGLCPQKSNGIATCWQSLDAIKSLGIWVTMGWGTRCSFQVCYNSLRKQQPLWELSVCHSHWSHNHRCLVPSTARAQDHTQPSASWSLSCHNPQFGRAWLPHMPWERLGTSDMHRS